MKTLGWNSVGRGPLSFFIKSHATPTGVWARPHVRLHIRGTFPLNKEERRKRKTGGIKTEEGSKDSTSSEALKVPMDHMNGEEMPWQWAGSLAGDKCLCFVFEMGAWFTDITYNSRSFDKFIVMKPSMQPKHRADLLPPRFPRWVVSVPLVLPVPRCHRLWGRAVCSIFLFFSFDWGVISFSKMSL